MYFLYDIFYRVRTATCFGCFVNSSLCTSIDGLKEVNCLDTETLLIFEQLSVNEGLNSTGTYGTSA